jgi:hypothetical protein
MEPREVLVVKTTSLATAVLADKTQTFLGPLNSGAEQGIEHWYHGMEAGGTLLTDNSDPASGDNDFTVENSDSDRRAHADWRSQLFSLGPAANGARPLSFSFDYKLPDPVKEGDNVHVQLRFYDQATNFINQKDFFLGSSSHDSAMTSYKTVVTENIIAPPKAQLSDVTMTANFYEQDRWSSGIGRFDNVIVAIPAPEGTLNHE